MSKILIVSLLQAVLAQSISSGRPYINANIDSGRQFYLRDPERDLEVRSYMQFRNANFNDYGPRSRQSEDYLYRHEPPNQRLLNNDRAVTQNDEYHHIRDPETDRYGRSDGVREESRVSGEVNNFGRGYRRITATGRNSQSRINNDQDNVNINFNSPSNIQSTNTDVTASEYNKKDNSHQQTIHQHVRTNKNSADNSDISRSTNQDIEITTVPELFVTSVTLKTNINTHSRFADTETGNDNLPEVKSNSDSTSFSDSDTQNHRELDKAPTDNEVKDSKNDTDDKDNVDRWVWSAVTTTSAPTKKVLLDGDLDDRTGLGGDGCPKGQAKVSGLCIREH